MINSIFKCHTFNEMVNLIRQHFYGRLRPSAFAGLFRLYGVPYTPFFYLYQYVKILLGENLQDFNSESTFALSGGVLSKPPSLRSRAVAAALPLFFQPFKNTLYCITNIQIIY